MAALYTYIHYYLVDHPFINNYEWKAGETFGASKFFLAVTVLTYLTLTFLINRFHILPTISANKIRLFSIAHNSFLCLLSLVMALACAISTFHQTPPGNPLWGICFPTETLARGPTFFWAHVFYFSKIYEFIDTLLIILSGSRSRRLSFLHVYHHTVVVIMCYLWIGAVQSPFPVGMVTNSMVHVLMYFYYLLCALGYRPKWKKLVTECQILQFLFVYLVAVLVLYLHFTNGSGCSGVWAWAFNVAFTTTLLALFLNFHFKNYASKKKSRQSKNN